MQLDFREFRLAGFGVGNKNYFYFVDPIPIFKQTQNFNLFTIYFVEN